ncbi:MAG: hypothetical protein C4521_12395 [Actinobacteria bacterium]|nr:MAG: hypothetical protein C4521_12395 [Actinomycetota bacterium]
MMMPKHPDCVGCARTLYGKCIAMVSAVDCFARTEDPCTVLSDIDRMIAYSQKRSSESTVSELKRFRRDYMRSWFRGRREAA